MPYSLSTLLALVLLLSGCAGGPWDSLQRDRPKFTKAELALLAFPQREGLPEPSGGFALAVGEQTVTSDEIIAPLAEQFSRIAQSSSFEQFKEQARPEIERVLLTRVSDILIFQQARKQAGLSSPSEGQGEQADEHVERLAQREVRKFVVGFGGDYARAEQALKQMGMDWADFKEYQKKMILSQSYIASQLPKQRPVTYSELLDCYNDMKDEFFATPAMIEFRLIDIQPEKLQMEEPNTSCREQAKKLVDELMRRLRAGEDFGELAKQYSHGHRASSGGLWKPVQPDSLARDYDVLAAQAKSIEPGQIAGPIETAAFPQSGVAEHIFIMRLEEKRQESVEPFEKVQSHVKAKVIFDRRKEAVDKLSARLVQQARLGRKNEFVDFCLKKIYQICNQ